MNVQTLEFRVFLFFQCKLLKLFKKLKLFFVYPHYQKENEEKQTQKNLLIINNQNLSTIFSWIDEVQSRMKN